MTSQAATSAATAGCRSDAGLAPARTCGAPVDVRSVVSDSGWVEQPPIRDMARIQFGQSARADRGHQRAGRRVQPRAGGLGLLLPPRAAVDRAADQARQHADEGRVEPHAGRHAAGHDGRPRPRPHRAVRQPRRRDHRGAAAARPADLGPRAPVPHAPPATSATTGTRPDVWYETGQDGDDRETHYPMGQYVDLFGAAGRARPAAAARAGQHVRPRPRARRDDPGPAQLAAVPGRDGAGRAAPGVPAEPWASPSGAARGATAPSGSGCSGPGRVAVQSVYQPPEDTEVIRRHSYATTHRW